MIPAPETSESLLLRLRDPDDQQAWFRFDEIYRPIVYRVARRQGWQDSDAEDLAQRVMMAVSKAIPEWERDPTKGGFRAWIYRIARNSLISTLRHRRHAIAPGGNEIMLKAQSLEAPADVIDKWIDQEHHRARLRLSAARIQCEFTERSWQAFWLTTLGGCTVDEASRSLSTSVGAIYAARSRIMRRLQEVAKLDDAAEQGTNHE